MTESSHVAITLLGKTVRRVLPPEFSHASPGSALEGQRKKRILGFPGIIAPATITTTITTASSILASQPCLHHHRTSPQLTSFCIEGKGTKVGVALRMEMQSPPRKFLRAHSTRIFGVVIAKYLSGESFDGCVFTPGIERQAGFAAGLLEKSFGAPIVFDGNLGQEQAAAAAERND